MNPTLQSILRCALKFGAASLATHGLMAGHLYSVIIGAIGGTIGLVWGVKSAKAKTVTVQAPPQSRNYRLGVLFAGLFLLFCIACLAFGCSSTTPASTAGKALETVNTGADTAMTAWGNYVAANHPGTNAELAVLHLYNRYKAAELVAVDAVTAWLASASTNSAVTNAPQDLVAAQAAEAQCLSDLVSGIRAFGVSLVP